MGNYPTGNNQYIVHVSYEVDNHGVTTYETSNHHIHIVRLSLTLFFLQFCSDLDEILHKGGSWDPKNRKNTEVWLP